jgi:hypothetical protein
MTKDETFREKARHKSAPNSICSHQEDDKAKNRQIWPRRRGRAKIRRQGKTQDKATRETKKQADPIRTQGRADIDKDKKETYRHATRREAHVVCRVFSCFFYVISPAFVFTLFLVLVLSSTQAIPIFVLCFLVLVLFWIVLDPNHPNPSRRHTGQKQIRHR